MSTFDVRALLDARGSEAFALHERYMNPQMPRILRTIGFDRDYVRAEGAYLVDRSGGRYLDFLAGFGVFALGRCHPGIEQALRDAIGLELPNLVQMECPPLSGLLAEALVARMPTDDYRCFFTNSGAESVETIVKFARAATGRPRILFADHAFHGLTTGALALNGGHDFRDRFGDLLPGATSVPFGDIDKGKAPYAKNADNGWVAMVQHYFVSALLPPDKTPREYYTEKISDDFYRAGVKIPLAELPAGATATASTRLYTGPEEQDNLKAVAPGLDLVVDYGWLTVIAAAPKVEEPAKVPEPAKPAAAP